jgi:hypothetical protein
MEWKVLYLKGYLDNIVLYNTVKVCLWRLCSPPYMNPKYLILRVFLWVM